MTDQKADSRHRKRSRLAGSFRVMLALLLLGIAFVQIRDRHECVVMPNGFLICRTTVFSSLVEPDADIAIKYPDGRIFLRGDKLMDFWDDDSFVGYLNDTPDGHANRFVYVNDIGLIRQIEQPELFDHYFNHKISKLKDDPSRSGGHVMRTYLLLYENSIFDKSGWRIGTGDDSTKFRKSWCPTVWLQP